MKHSYLFSIPLALLLVASSAQADDTENPGRHHDRQGPDMEKRVQRMSEELDLSSEQTAQLQAVMEAAASEREAVREKYEAQIKPELCALHLATMEQVREILSPEQADEMESRLNRWAAAEGPEGRHRGKGRALKDCEQPG
jgi:Spy/CpxP family protein refolding chaperone